MTKTLLITGATSDLGQVVAAHFDQKGYHLLLLDHEQLLLESLDETLQADHTLIPFNTWAADATLYGQLASMIEQDYPALDGIIYCEMYVDNLTPMVHCPPETWLKALQINLTAPLWLLQALLPNLMAAETPHVVFTTHDQHKQQPAYWHGFGVSQSALHSVIDALNIEKTPYEKLRFAIVDTGWIDTSFNRNIYPDGQSHWLTPDAIMPLYEQALAHDEEYVGRFANESIKACNNG